MGVITTPGPAGTERLTLASKSESRGNPAVPVRELGQNSENDSPPFDPKAWLAALTAIGGGYALTAERRLWLMVDDCDADDLSIVMSHLIGRPDRQDATKRAIERRQIGQA